MIEWLSTFTSWERELLGSLIGSALAGVLAASFAIGGLWALRGRAALQVPTCRRCRSLLRGEGHAIPERCPECGAALTRGARAHRAVRWLRFRRQWLTVFVTAPTVLLGGTVLAVIGAVMTIKPFEDALRQRDDRLARQATHDLASVEPESSASAPAPPVIVDLVRDARAGGERGAAAFIELAGHVTDSVMVARNASDAERDAVVGLCLDILARRAPAAPFPRAAVEPDWQRAYRTSGALAGRILGDFLAVDRLSIDEVLTRTAGALPTVTCVAPKRVRAGALCPIALVSTTNGWSPMYSITKLTDADGEEIPTRGRESLGRVPAEELGTLEFGVEWHSTVSLPGPTANSTVLVREEFQSSTVRVEVVDEPVEFEEIVDPALGPDFQLTWSSLEVTPVGERSNVLITLQHGAAVALVGTWSLRAPDWSADLGPGALSFELGHGLVKLCDPPRVWPDEITLHFEPCDARCPPTLLEPDQWHVGRWGRPFDLTLRQYGPSAMKYRLFPPTW